MSYIVYRTINQITTEFYIGVHKLSKKNNSYLGSGLRLKLAIKKYGRYAFSRQTLAEFTSAAEAFTHERELLENYLNDPKCYNIASGGNGGWDHINHSSKKAAISAKGGKTRWSKVLSDLEIELAKEAGRKGGKVSGPTAFKGRKHSNKTKEQMSKSRKKAKSQKGKQAWVYHEHLRCCRRISVLKLQAFLREGWTKGRKMVDRMRIELIQQSVCKTNPLSQSAAHCMVPEVGIEPTFTGTQPAA